MYVSKETVDTTLGPWDGCHLASWEELIKLEKAMQDRYKKKKTEIVQNQKGGLRAAIFYGQDLGF